MSILLSIIPPIARLFVDGDIEFYRKPLPIGKAYIYETKKFRGCGMVIGEVEIINGNYTDRSKFESAKRYDKPIPLSEFRVCKKIRKYHKQGENFTEHLLHGGRIEVKQITRPPRSWCYVEDLKGEK